MQKLPEQQAGARWEPRWSDELLMAAIPMEGTNDRGLPGMERLNVLMDLAHDSSTGPEVMIQPWLYPVYGLEEPFVPFEGIAVACEDWIEEEGPEAQRMYYEDEDRDDGWRVSWHGQGVREFPFGRSNACLALLYQRELDEGVGRLYRIHFHVVRNTEHDTRCPIGLLITTSDGDDMSADVVRALYDQLMEETR